MTKINKPDFKTYEKIYKDCVRKAESREASTSEVTLAYAKYLNEINNRPDEKSVKENGFNAAPIATKEEYMPLFILAWYERNHELPSKEVIDYAYGKYCKMKEEQATKAVKVNKQKAVTIKMKYSTFKAVYQSLMETISSEIPTDEQVLGAYIKYLEKSGGEKKINSKELDAAKILLTDSDYTKLFMEVWYTMYDAEPSRNTVRNSYIRYYRNAIESQRKAAANDAKRKETQDFLQSKFKPKKAGRHEKDDEQSNKNDVKKSDNKFYLKNNEETIAAFNDLTDAITCAKALVRESPKYYRIFVDAPDGKQYRFNINNSQK